MSVLRPTGLSRWQSDDKQSWWERWRKWFLLVMLFDTMQPDEWLCCKSDRSLKSELDWRWSFRACQRTGCCAAAVKRNLVFRPVHPQLQAISSNTCWFGWQQDDVTIILLKQKHTTQKVRRDGVVRGEQPWDVRPSAAWEVPELCEKLIVLKRHASTCRWELLSQVAPREVQLCVKEDAACRLWSELAPSLKPSAFRLIMPSSWIETGCLQLRWLWVESLLLTWAHMDEGSIPSELCTLFSVFLLCPG